MLCSTVSIPDHYGQGATTETEQFRFLWHKQTPAQATDGL